jgi:hypothetical protein
MIRRSAPHGQDHPVEELVLHGALRVDPKVFAKRETKLRRRRHQPSVARSTNQHGRRQHPSGPLPTSPLGFRARSCTPLRHDLKKRRPALPRSIGRYYRGGRRPQKERPGSFCRTPNVPGTDSIGGGDVSIEETGSKQFIRTIYGLPLCSIPYFRHASLGIMRSVVSRGCTKCEVTELASTATTMQWQVSWV